MKYFKKGEEISGSKIRLLCIGRDLIGGGAEYVQLSLLKHLDRNKLEESKRYYYTLMGWDKNGIPLPQKVEELCIE